MPRVPRERGSNLIELALVLPVLLMLFATVVDFGRLYFTYVAVIDAAHEGARYGAAHPNETARDANICAAALQEAAGQPFVLADATTLSCARDVTISTSGAPGTPVSVTVRFTVPILLGNLVGNPTLQIRHTAAFRIRCEVGTGC